MYSVSIAAVKGISTFQVLMYLFFVVGVVLLAYASTLYIAKLYARGTKNKNIKIIEKMNLAADKGLWLVELDRYVYFVYIDKHGMTKLDKFDKSALNLVQPKKTNQPIKGNKIFEHYLQKGFKKYEK